MLKLVVDVDYNPTRTIKQRSIFYFKVLKIVLTKNKIEAFV